MVHSYSSGEQLVHVAGLFCHLLQTIYKLNLDGHVFYQQRNPHDAH